MSPAPVPRGLYAITPQWLCEDEARLADAVEAALAGGAVMIQYRDKHGDATRRRSQAARLRRLCDTHGARLIINDDVELALESGADGVHLGRSDGSLADARRRLGPAALIGASCGPSLARAFEVLGPPELGGGADHVAFGRFHASTTKPNAPQADLELLSAAREVLRVPICVIGGITPTLAPALVARGADLVAAVAGVFGHAPDTGAEGGTLDQAAIRTAAQAYATLFAPGGAPSR